MNRAQPIGLTPVRGNLCQEFVVGNACACDQVQLVANIRLDPLGHIYAENDAHLVICDIEIRFVDRNRLNQIRVPVKNIADLHADFFVMTHPTFDKDQLRTKHFGSRARHGTVHAEFSGFITCRRHYASRIGVPHRHGFAAQLRMITLLHGRVERIHINMDDLAVGDVDKGRFGSAHGEKDTHISAQLAASRFYDVKKFVRLTHKDSSFL